MVLLGSHTRCRSSGQIGLRWSGIGSVGGENFDDIQDLPIQAVKVFEQLILSLIDQLERRVLVFLIEQNRRFPWPKNSSVPEHP